MTLTPDTSQHVSDQCSEYYNKGSHKVTLTPNHDLTLPSSGQHTMLIIARRIQANL